MRSHGERAATWQAGLAVELQAVRRRIARPLQFDVELPPIRSSSAAVEVPARRSGSAVIDARAASARLKRSRIGASTSSRPERSARRFDGGPPSTVGSMPERSRSPWRTPPSAEAIR